MTHFTGDYLLTLLITFITIIDPLGVIPVYLPIASRFDKKSRKKVILFSFCIATAVATLFLVLGKYLFSYLGISADAMMICGGVLLFLVGFEMMTAKPRSTTSSPEEIADYAHIKEISVFPLAFPLICGPGVIATIIMFSSKDHSIENTILMFMVIVLGFSLSALTMLFSERLLKIFGRTGLNVIDRVMGITLAALAVQFIINAIINIIRNY